MKGEKTLLAADEWTELHVTFKVEKSFPQGWFASHRRRARRRPAEGGPFPDLRGGLRSFARVLRKRVTKLQRPARSLSPTRASRRAPEPWSFTCGEQYNVRRTYRRASFALARLLANMGVAAPTPLLERFHAPVTAAKPEKRWLALFYLDQPEEWDDPYRFFNW